MKMKSIEEGKPINSIEIVRINSKDYLTPALNVGKGKPCSCELTNFESKLVE